ncbi:DUF2121 family protein [Methanobacterium congolense]|uniref:DUF2121 domain-containing protein n=1 Tax=Methanobacterium congolense TaxID=118062 RepID=A0A1D3L2C2_9EURY|nr:DUF2121 domain-containing protein [Methanobacterium congolense]SCG85659.1 putative protein MJ0548 [Methanobacterium congolense]
MSLIITYVGSKGCVMAGDKRRIGFFGDEANREKLEEKLYSGEIRTDEELLKRASELEITLKITDDAEKVREIDDVAVGEVRFKTPFKTKRKRIYGTTGAYNIVELLGSDIKTIKGGESSIVVFGNKMTKEIANKTIKDNWKNKTSLQDIAKLFSKVMEDVARQTPSVSQEHDVIIKHPSMEYKEAKELLRTTIIQDVKDLTEWRNSLKEELLKTTETIQMATRIISEGEVGKITSISGDELEVTLKKGVEALDMEWKPLKKAGESVTMQLAEAGEVNVGDKVVVEKENLCIKRSKAGLTCSVIICREEK